jgi:hypothetical protein
MLENSVVRVTLDKTWYHCSGNWKKRKVRNCTLYQNRRTILEVKLKCFKIRTPTCIEKYFQKVRDQLRSWRSAPQNSAVLWSNLNCLEKRCNNIQADAGFDVKNVPQPQPTLMTNINQKFCTKNSNEIKLTSINVQAVYDNVEEYGRVRQAIIWQHNSGTGKIHFACRIAKSRVKTHTSVIY